MAHRAATSNARHAELNRQMRSDGLIAVSIKATVSGPHRRVLQVERVRTPDIQSSAARQSGGMDCEISERIPVAVL